MSFPKIKRHPWRKAKTLAMLANRRQWRSDSLPAYSTEVEIQAENGAFILSEVNKYLITE